MSALAEQIAREHVLYRATEDGGKGVYGQPLEVYVGYECECGWTTTNAWDTSLHIATVTERAARERAAVDVPEQIARYVEATATDLSPSGYKAGIATAVRLIRRWRPEYTADRIARGDTDE